MKEIYIPPILDIHTYDLTSASGVVDSRDNAFVGAEDMP